MTSQQYERWEELLDRDIAGEALTEEEREFLRRFGAEHPVCAAERLLLSELERG
jgi:hypothetical protein